MLLYRWAIGSLGRKDFARTEPEGRHPSSVWFAYRHSKRHALQATRQLMQFPSQAFCSYPFLPVLPFAPCWCLYKECNSPYCWPQIQFLETNSWKSRLKQLYKSSGRSKAYTRSKTKGPPHYNYFGSQFSEAISLTFGLLYHESHQWAARITCRNAAWNFHTPWYSMDPFGRWASVQGMAWNSEGAADWYCSGRMYTFIRKAVEDVWCH